jgi:ectoine hydroxylase-related dioxygenase (phytanoyl-CoA dioxygenase family)
MNTNVPFAEWPDALKVGAASLNQEQLSDFGRDGYVVIDLDIPDFDAVADTVIRDLAPRYAGGHRIQDAWRISAEVKALAANKRILNTLRLLYGRNAFPFQTLNFNLGTEQPTHSDSIHFHSFPHHFMAGVWVALESTDGGNGPLRYYPGSHKLPAYTLADVGVRGSDGRGSYDDYVKHYEPFIADVVVRNGLKPSHAHLRRGQALIWASNLLHGGSPITDQGRTRHSQVTHYYFDDCVYYTPVWSDPMERRNHYRSPRNILTGKAAAQSYCGRPFSAPLMVRATELVKNTFAVVLRRKR